MELTITLKKEEWELVLEVLNLNDTIQIKGMAIGLLKPQLDEQFQKLQSAQ